MHGEQGHKWVNDHEFTIHASRVHECTIFRKYVAAAAKGILIYNQLQQGI